MKLWESVRMALGALGANKVRSSLTMLGIIIGVTAVISLISIGRGAQGAISSEIEGLGSNLIYITPGSTSQGGVRTASGSALTLTMTDAVALEDPLNAPSLSGVAPEVSRSGQAVAQGNNTNARIIGVTADYERVRNLDVAGGEFITPEHVEAGAAVVVLGSQSATDLFGDADPLGQTVYVNRVAFQVVGVLESKGGSSFTSPDEGFYVPITTAQSRLPGSQFYRGSRTVSSIAVQVKDPSLVDQAQEEIRQTLRRLHRLTEEDDFSLQSQQDFLSAISQVTTIMTLFLAAIAAISLLVGGIGIMNIMLVSITERTREIGIRKAVGARERDILFQFLVEAMFLSLVGGVVGILLGAGIAGIISGIDLGGSRLQSSVELDVAALAVAFSAGVGLFFGVYPAWRAARLNPIDALRSE